MVSLRKLARLMGASRSTTAGSALDKRLSKVSSSFKRGAYWARRRALHVDRAESLACQLTESTEMHGRWEDAAQGRLATELEPEELKQLVYGGVPMKYRLQLWADWISTKGVQAVDLEKLQNLASAKAAGDIAKDVARTHPKQLNDEQLLSLQRVLLAYAGWNPVVGYCQGMNFIAAIFILLGFGDSESFAGLCLIVEDICPGYHVPDLCGFHRDAIVLDELVHQFLPSVHAELADFGVSVQLLAIDHLISLTSSSWPVGATVRLWDVILMEGARAVFASFLALLELYMPTSNLDTGVLPASVAPDGDVTAFELMEFFKKESSRGVNNDMDAIMNRTRRYMQIIPEALIVSLRA